jgi:hypothetical protein
MNRKQVTFIVEGSGRFPIDMLRYDSAVPASEIDSGEIDRIDVCRIIGLVSPHHPTRERWQSFGWKILSTEVSR